VGKVGYSLSGQLGVFQWCRFHRDYHLCTLEQILHVLCELSDHDGQLRQSYVATLNKAILDVNACEKDGIIAQKEESA
jgi:hypothetical protein